MSDKPNHKYWCKESKRNFWGTRLPMFPKVNDIEKVARVFSSSVGVPYNSVQYSTFNF